MSPQSPSVTSPVNDRPSLEAAMREAHALTIRAAALQDTYAERFYVDPLGAAEEAMDALQGMRDEIDTTVDRVRKAPVRTRLDRKARRLCQLQLRNVRVAIVTAMMTIRRHFYERVPVPECKR